MKTESYVVPAFLVPYFAYGDATGMTDMEIAKADAFMRDNNLSHLVSADSDNYFGQFHDVPGLPAGDVVDAYFVVNEEEV